jgi:phosphatidate cytidylyltransferase
MLRQRILVVVILLPIGLVAIYLGGWVYTLMITVILGAAGWEFAQLFKSGGLKPAISVVLIGIVALVAGRYWNSFESAAWIISLVILLAMTYHLVDFERGRDQAGTDFGITLAGILYIGWIGAYMISLRQLDQGMWWVLLVLPATWIADSGANFVGSRFGKHKLTPRLSPKKTWEGYLGGIVWGVLGTALLTWIWQLLGADASVITVQRGMLIGLVMGTFPTLGDLGESMVKRQVGVKDSSHLLPGHGGAFDRIDSWLWAAVFGFYLISWLWY